jgi:hypothetical protein
MALVVCIFLPIADIARLTTKSTLDINTPIHQPMALFMQELNTFMQGEQMGTIMLVVAVVMFHIHTPTQTETTLILMGLEMGAEWIQVADIITDLTLTEMV